MSTPQIERPELPEYMTWEELERLPEELASQIELWDGRVVWVRRGPAEHQDYTNLMWASLRRAAQRLMDEQTGSCWRVSTETNVFLGTTGKSDFVTPDFLVYRCLETEFQDIRSADVLLAGEVLSPSNTQTDIEAKKARYASSGIPWYWEVRLARNPRGIASVRAYGLEINPAELPEGVRPLRRANYLVAGEWFPGETNGIDFDHPFPIHIPWTELEY
ncbi:Uma2 family endonuclease [Nocardia cyriacigeorgica]|uniref:Uma2 family endonuclease n=1 Tax=Nocardia cyriacigeorgica TaxID=135487 RepID=A0A5R8P5M3_9NOCA|nr:Uma2 family endonuclease [Nocardia cyriacigeorgica]TLF93552.1 Uma2 family endonuclease [Nocardia cyriacigeorgica]